MTMVAEVQSHDVGRLYVQDNVQVSTPPTLKTSPRRRFEQVTVAGSQGVSTWSSNLRWLWTLHETVAVNSRIKFYPCFRLQVGTNFGNLGRHGRYQIPRRNAGWFRQVDNLKSAIWRLPDLRSASWQRLRLSLAKTCPECTLDVRFVYTWHDPPSTGSRQIARRCRRPGCHDWCGYPCPRNRRSCWQMGHNL